MFFHNITLKETDRLLKMSTFFIFLLSLDMVFLFRDRALKAFYECFVTYLYRAIVSKSKCSTQLIVTKLLHCINCRPGQSSVRLLGDKMSLRKQDKGKNLDISSVSWTLSRGPWTVECAGGRSLPGARHQTSLKTNGFGKIMKKMRCGWVPSLFSRERKRREGRQWRVFTQCITPPSHHIIKLLCFCLSERKLFQHFDKF